MIIPPYFVKRLTRQLESCTASPTKKSCAPTDICDPVFHFHMIFPSASKLRKSIVNCLADNSKYSKILQKERDKESTCFDMNLVQWRVPPVLQVPNLIVQAAFQCTPSMVRHRLQVSVEHGSTKRPISFHTHRGRHKKATHLLPVQNRKRKTRHTKQHNVRTLKACTVRSFVLQTASQSPIAIIIMGYVLCPNKIKRDARVTYNSVARDKTRQAKHPNACRHSRFSGYLHAETTIIQRRFFLLSLPTIAQFFLCLASFFLLLLFFFLCKV